MPYPLKRRISDCFSDHPELNRKALCFYRSLQEVNRLINPPQTEHTKKKKNQKNMHCR